MDSVLVIVGTIAIAIVFASFAPRPRIRQSNLATPASLPPPLPSNVGDQQAKAVGSPDVEGQEGEPEEIAEAAKAKARDLVTKSDVDSAACDILGMVQNWPKLAEANNGQPPLPFDAMTEGRMPAEQVGERDGRWVNWSGNGTVYRLELWTHPNSGRAFEDDLQLGDLQLWVDGEAVMQLHVAKRAEVQHERWVPFGVCSLRAGSWMLRLNELAACLRTAEERHADAAEKMGDATASRRSPLASSPPRTDDEYGGGKTQGPGSPDEPTQVARASTQASDW